MPTSEKNGSSKAKAVLDLVLGRLAAAAREGDGAVSVDILEDVRAAILPDLTALIEDRAAPKPATGKRSREYAFHRLMVSHFEHLLPQHRGDPGVPREILPGFFRALDMMLGVETVENYHDRCQAIVDRVRAERGADFRWRAVYDDPETNELLIEPLIVMASYFDDIDRRVAWFVDLVNGHAEVLAHHRGVDPKSIPQLTVETFQTILAALYRQVREVMGDKSRCSAIEARYGAEACVRLARLTARLSTVEKSVKDGGG